MSDLEAFLALAAELREQVRWAEAIGGRELCDLGRGQPVPPPGARTPTPSPAAPGESPGEAILRQLRGRAPAPATVAEVAPAPPEPPAAPAPIAPAPREAPGGLPHEERVRRLAVTAAEVASCRRCRLCEGRTKTVFSRGSPSGVVAFVGEGPGYNEDQEGLPFVGAAGQLLDKMIAAMGLGPDELYVCNVVKCRPPENRTPQPDEAAACAPYLRAQLEIVAPRVIVALGRCAAENLGCALPARSWRGIWGTYEGVPVMPTYHPAYLLRSPEMKRPVWEDLQKVLARLGRTAPTR